MGEQVKDQFNILSSDYDARRRLLIPRFDDFYKTGIELLAYEGPAPRVLDIGAGTGILTEVLFDRYPGAKVTLIDFADQMLDVAKEKFKDIADIRFIAEDYSTYDFGSEKYDIVISALSIHHLDHSGVKDIYKKVYDLLPDGGEFINADLANSGIPGIDAKYDALWTAFVLKNIGEGEHFDRFMKNKEVDNPLPTLNHFLWLREVGFTGIECVFRYYNFSVIYGKK